MKIYTTKELFDLEHTLARPLLEGFTYPWEALSGIREWIEETGKTLSREEYDEISPSVWVSRTAKVAPTAYLGAPLIIGPKAEIRHGAFLRGSIVVGSGCVVGNSTELKNVILFDGVQVPHYNYVGDSILGFCAHMGAGAITSNIKADKKNIVIRCGDERKETGLRKMGAMLGDYVDVGCNSVLNPGSIVGRNTNIYPLSMVRGVIPEGSIYKNAGEIVAKIEEE